MPRRNKPTVSHTRFAASMPCSNKRAFSNESDAQKAIELSILRDMKLTLHSYGCPYCRNWHLSSKK